MLGSMFKVAWKYCVMTFPALHQLQSAALSSLGFLESTSGIKSYVLVNNENCLFYYSTL